METLSTSTTPTFGLESVVSLICGTRAHHSLTTVKTCKCLVTSFTAFPVTSIELWWSLVSRLHRGPRKLPLGHPV